MLIRGGDTLHLQLDTDVHHATGDIQSTHVDDRSEAGNGSEPAVNAHRSAINSGVDALDEASGTAVMQLLHQLQTNVFLCILDVANLRGSGYQ